MILQDKIVKAVQLINPNAQFGLSGDNIDDIVWEDGTAPISKSDIEAKLTQAQNELNAEAQTAIDKKASGKQKLKDLGLDDEEINALIG